MSYAPSDLLTCRAEIRRHTGLPAVAVGIVGDPAHDGGYHCGEDRTAPDDYSRDESPRDARPTDAASAIDIGNDWPAGGTARAYAFNAALVEACRQGDPRARDVREVIYTTDGRTVRRFDRLGIRTTGDKSHLFHTHVSFFRDSEGRRAATTGFLGLVLELLGVTDVDANQDILLKGAAWRTHTLINNLPAVPPEASGGVAGQPNRLYERLAALTTKVDSLALQVDAILTAVAAAGGAPSLLPVLAAIESLRKALHDSATDAAANLATDSGLE